MRERQSRPAHATATLPRDVKVNKHQVERAKLSTQLGSRDCLQSLGPSPTKRFLPSRQLGEVLDIDLSLTTITEVTKAVTRLKNNKAAGIDNISAELLKAGGPTSLMVRIWNEEVIPDDWKRS